MKNMITRRNFLAAAGVVAAAGVLTACGGSSSSAAASRLYRSLVPLLPATPSRSASSDP